jgi:F0F1-type ATP synthase membrane subunit c/vacuolar-type H+-ATPase subunit K
MPSIDESLDVNGVADGTSVKAGGTVAGIAVGVGVSTAAAVSVGITSGNGVDGDAQAPRRSETKTSSDFFMIFVVCRCNGQPQLRHQL